MAKFISYLQTKSFRNNLIAAIATVAILLFIAFFSLRYYTKHGQGLNVPAVKGMAFNQAVSKLEALGLRYEVDSVYIMDLPPGTVIDQDPEANTFVKDNRTIYLTINTAQAPNVKFPDVQFKSFIEAQAIIASFGLKVGDTVYKADVSKDVVLEVSFGGSSIKPGDVIPKGSKIDLLLGDGRGNEDVEIPALLGFTKDEAAFSLRGSNLKLGTITYEGNITDTANAVITAQDPALSDTLGKVKIGTPVNITLSNKK
ncbi:PASTA domain-containing protein [Pedobacter cryoconitis]|uniref:Beta-lactam-binding protein with PASTA domain n=1 Tax=Pedobacter cryoconitis TaxID=188932 RepID=A0A327SZH2_9SPHI|nr:PASTA domain-containing protein [Pedobacter cryoconitis]MBB5623751.1 beta-lactam-binding protein with PASTA domain [Pedobacter cryoconitis]MBB5645162.1 beta-lactam-binding protein with PASTA domain [Pedobacter cryoconitis]RAJ32883.1 PASTA domain-containing protein [Pedobacter cryoconitis]